jgi:hypothetical protein
MEDGLHDCTHSSHGPPIRFALALGNWGIGGDAVHWIAFHCVPLPHAHTLAVAGDALHWIACHRVPRRFKEAPDRVIFKLRAEPLPLAAVE